MEYTFNPVIGKNGYYRIKMIDSNKVLWMAVVLIENKVAKLTRAILYSNVTYEGFIEVYQYCLSKIKELDCQYLTTTPYYNAAAKAFWATLPETKIFDSENNELSKEEILSSYSGQIANLKGCIIGESDTFYIVVDLR